jgi:hypothetical protein
MKEPTATKCRDHRAISLIAHAARILRTGTTRKMEDIIAEDGLDLAEDKELGIKWDVENFRTNFAHRRRIVCSLHCLAKGVLPYKLYQINADPKVNWYGLERKKIDQKIVHGTEC